MTTMGSPTNRAFGLLLSTVFAALALWHLATSGLTVWATLWLACAGLVLVLSLFIPSVLTPVNRAWMKLGSVLNRIVSPLLLTTMYGTLIIPVGLYMRLIGRDILHIKKKTVSSHWIVRKEQDIAPERFKDQF